MATLVHDDLIDGAEFRRGRTAAWPAFGPDAAKAAGDYLFARAFAELAATGDAEAVATLADATLRLARGEALQRSQAHDPETPVEAYLERCALKTGKLFEAACRLGGGSGAFGLALGIAFQIADDILDCAGRRSRPARSPAPTCARARRRCRSCSRRRTTRSCAPRSPVARSTARSCGSPRAARSSGRARSRSTTLGRPGRTSTASRTGTSSRP